jgi:oligoribonuclease NrnB/cAMP/cGMP phosphodiesterase (DHH superfamily)
MDILFKMGCSSPRNRWINSSNWYGCIITWEWERQEQQQAKRLNYLFDEFEEKILDMEDERIERYVQRKKREIIQTSIHDQFIGIVHAESYHSELGNEIGKDNPHLDYIA